MDLTFLITSRIINQSGAVTLAGLGGPGIAVTAATLASVPLEANVAEVVQLVELLG